MKTMMLHPTRRALLLALACGAPLAAQEALAMAVAGGQTAGTPSPTVVRAAPALPASAAPTLDVSRGTLEAVNLGKRQVVIAGRTVDLHPTRLKVVGPGGRNEPGASALRKGMVVRFALDPTSKAVNRPIVLVYID